MRIPQYILAAILSLQSDLTSSEDTPIETNLIEERKIPDGFSLIRIFKEEHELEVWKSKNNVYELYKTYTICKFSGNLGPKYKEGDKQAPEGFYFINRSSMKHEHRMDIGYPNSFDKYHHRTGSDIQIHGSCSSVGCFAMTNKYILDINKQVRRSLSNGQTEIQVHSYPFRMTEENISKYSTNKNWPFWEQLKRGYDVFNKHNKDLDISVSNGKYIINGPVV